MFKPLGSLDLNETSFGARSLPFRKEGIILAMSLALISNLLLVPPSISSEDTANRQVWHLSGTNSYKRLAVIDRDKILTSWEKGKRAADEVKKMEEDYNEIIPSANRKYETSKNSGISGNKLVELQSRMQTEINTKVKSIQDAINTKEQELENEFDSALSIEAKLRGVDIVVVDGAVCSFIPEESRLDLTDAVKNRLANLPNTEKRASTPASSVPLRFAVLDREEVAQGYEKARTANAYLQSQSNEIKKLVDSSNARYNERKDAGASPTEISALQASLQIEIDKKVKQLENYTKQAETQLEEEIKQALLEQAKLQNVNVVIIKASAPVVFPEAANIDLTGSVIKLLNERGASLGQVSASKPESPNLGSEIEALTRQIQQEPQNTDLYLSRSILYFAVSSQLSSFEDAKKVLDMVSSKTSLSSNEEYKQQMAVIMMCLFSERNNDKAVEEALLKKARSTCNKNQWPYPLIQYLSGELTEGSIVAPNTDAQMEKQIIVGFRKLLQGKAAEATVNFRAVLKLPVVAKGLGKTDYKKVSMAMLSILTH